MPATNGYRFAPAKPAFQPAGSRILTPGVAVTSTALGHATLLPKWDKLALSTESAAMHNAVNQHWEAIQSGKQPAVDKLPAAGGHIVTGAQLKAQLMGHSLVLGYSDVYKEGLSHDPKPRRKLHRATAPLPGDGIGGDARATLLAAKQPPLAAMLTPAQPLRLLGSAGANAAASRNVTALSAPRRGAGQQQQPQWEHQERWQLDKAQTVEAGWQQGASAPTQVRVGSTPPKTAAGLTSAQPGAMAQREAAEAHSRQQQEQQAHAVQRPSFTAPGGATVGVARPRAPAGWAAQPGRQLAGEWQQQQQAQLGWGAASPAAPMHTPAAAASARALAVEGGGMGAQVHFAPAPRLR